MLVTDTDDSKDHWVEYYDTLPALREAVRDLVRNEWGLRAIYDPASGANLGANITIAFEAAGTTRGRKPK